jgi:hypothetical protein
MTWKEWISGQSLKKKNTFSVVPHWKYRADGIESQHNDLERMDQWIILILNFELYPNTESQHDDLEGIGQRVILKKKIRSRILYLTGGTESRQEDLERMDQWIILILNFVIYQKKNAFSVVPHWKYRADGIES